MIELENDLAQQPIGLAHFTEDLSVLATGYVSIGLLASSFLGPLALVVAAIAALNDVQWVKAGKPAPKPAPALPQAQDYPALPSIEDEPEPVTQTGIEPGSTPTAIAAPGVLSEDDRLALIARLRDECPSLLRLVKSHPIRAVGVQRSGKTTLVKRLALLRMVLLPGHQAIASTPHYEPENAYPQAIKALGVAADGGRDYPAIANAWTDMAHRVESCQQSNLTYIWDEFGLFDKVMDEDRIKSVLTSSLRETMKFGIYPIFIIHGETAAFLPGSKGLVTVLLNSTVRLEAIGELTIGADGLETIRPTGGFSVTWLDGSREEGKIPGWLTEEYLLSLLGSKTPPRVPTMPASPVTLPEVWEEDAKAFLQPQKAVQTEVEESDPWAEFPVHGTILKYISSNGPKTRTQIRERLRKDRGAAKADSTQVDGAIAYLLFHGYLLTEGELLTLAARNGTPERNSGTP